MKKPVTTAYPEDRCPGQNPSRIVSWRAIILQEKKKMCTARTNTSLYALWGEKVGCQVIGWRERKKDQLLLLIKDRERNENDNKQKAPSRQISQSMGQIYDTNGRVVFFSFDLGGASHRIIGHCCILHVSVPSPRPEPVWPEHEHGKRRVYAQISYDVMNRRQ